MPLPRFTEQKHFEIEQGHPLEVPELVLAIDEQGLVGVGSRERPLAQVQRRQ